MNAQIATSASPDQAVSAAPPQRRVLFASSFNQWSLSAMLKADTFAQSLHAQLLVLHVSNFKVGHTSLFHRSRVPEELLRIEHLEQAQAAALERCNYVLPGRISETSLFVRHGDFAKELIQTISEQRIDLVVIPPERKGYGLLAMDIALATKVPVLLARLQRSHNVVVAATSLLDERYPVIRQAGQVSTLLGAQTLLMHNVAPVQLPGGLERGGLLLQVSREQVVATRKELLTSVSRKLPRAVDSVVKSNPNTAQAILETARECDADLIVLGVDHRCSRFARLFGGGVSARVAERAHRSILLTPIARSSSEDATRLLPA